MTTGCGWSNRTTRNRSLFGHHNSKALRRRMAKLELSGKVKWFITSEIDRVQGSATGPTAALIEVLGIELRSGTSRSETIRRTGFAIETKEDPFGLICSCVTSVLNSMTEAGFGICFTKFHLDTDRFPRKFVPVLKSGLRMAFEQEGVMVDEELGFLRFVSDWHQRIAESRISDAGLEDGTCDAERCIGDIEVGISKAKERVFQTWRASGDAKQAAREAEEVAAERMRTAPDRKKELEALVERLTGLKKRSRVDDNPEAKRAKAGDAPVVEPGKAATEPNPATPEGTGPERVERTTGDVEGEIQTRA